MKKTAGFTLTEMLIVIALIALIGTFVTTRLMNRYTKAKVQATKIQMRQIGVVLDQFKLDCNFYPSTEQGLESLLHKPEGLNCKNYDPDGYLQNKKLPKDGFGHTFLYTSDGNSFELRSLGQDGKTGGKGFNKDLSSKDLE